MTQGTIILPCNCKHEDQDAMYGKGNRAHNISGKSGSELAFCTVCTPRRLSTERNALRIDPQPIFGMLVAIPACGSRRGKPIPKR